MKTNFMYFCMFLQMHGDVILLILNSNSEVPGTLPVENIAFQWHFWLAEYGPHVNVVSVVIS